MRVVIDITPHRFTQAELANLAAGYATKRPVAKLATREDYERAITSTVEALGSSAFDFDFPIGDADRHQEEIARLFPEYHRDQIPYPYTPPNGGNA